MKQDIGSSQYWDKRVIEIPDRKDMLFLDGRREEYWRRVRNLLTLWNNRSALDVCCGYGQFANIFQRYEGIDFSEEMLRLARRDHPHKTFVLGDAKNPPATETFDIVFEVNSLHSMGITAEQFCEIYKGRAREYVLCLEADRFTIFNLYEGREHRPG